MDPMLRSVGESRQSMLVRIIPIFKGLSVLSSRLACAEAGIQHISTAVDGLDARLRSDGSQLRCRCGVSNFREI